MNVVACFAHPDDEVLGAGGTLAKHAEAGDAVYFHVLTTTRATPGLIPAMKALGIWQIAEWEYEDQKLDTLPFSKLVGSISKAHDPDVIYTHHPGDLNLDHALTARAVLTAFRPKPGTRPCTILACEVLSSTEWTFPQVFQPNWFVGLDIANVDKKVRALQCYPSELEWPPHPRSGDGIWGAARYRGRQCGVPYAEAFQLLRRSC